jgi:DNA-binding GntR family transcriptional regulator
VKTTLELEKVENDTLSGRVHKVLRLSILSGDLEAGQPLCIEELAEELGVSTTPVREALVRLAGDGLVDLQRNRQPLVALISTEEISQVYAIRRLLEPYFGQRLAARAYKDAAVVEGLCQLQADITKYVETLDAANEDSDVYSEYVELERRLQEALLPSGETDLIGKTAALVNNYVYRLRIFSQETRNRERRARMRGVCVEHLQILNALLDGDVPGIERTILDHLTHSEERSLAARQDGSGRSRR